MNDLVNSLVNSFLDGVERLKDWLAEAWDSNRPMVLAVGALILCIFLALIVLAVLPKKSDKGPEEIPASVEYFLEYPSEPDFVDEYILEKKEAVVEESFITDWFSPVDDAMLENLDQVTRTITDSILEAVP